MNTRQFLSIFLLLATLLWACQKEKQPVITKLPDSKPVLVQDSMQQHLTLADSVCGKYLVSGLYDAFHSGGPEVENRFNINNDTLIISKCSDSSITYFMNAPYQWGLTQINGGPCPRTANQSGNYTYGFLETEGLYTNSGIAFPINNLDSVYISFHHTHCDNSLDYNLSGTKIH